MTVFADESDSKFRPIVVRTYSSGHHAHLCRSHLESEGVRCVVDGDQLTDTLAFYGNAVAKVNLLVDEQDLEQANALLDELEQAPQPTGFDRWGIATNPDWKCGTCEEAAPASFQECWSCGAERPSDAETVLPDAPSTKTDGSGFTADESAETDLSPYRPPGAKVVAQTAEKQEATYSEKAFRAAVMGLVFPVPMAFVAMTLCWTALSNGDRNRRLFWALIFCVPMSIFTMIMLLAIVQHVLRLVGFG